MLSGASYRSFRGFAVTFTPILPYALAFFAAGAMIL
jgi:hypothetical protein